MSGVERTELVPGYSISRIIKGGWHLAGGHGTIDRAQAINEAVGILEPDDILVVAGKGHETGQIVGGEIIPFDDRDQVRRAVAGIGGAS